MTKEEEVTEPTQKKSDEEIARDLIQKWGDETDGQDVNSDPVVLNLLNAITEALAGARREAMEARISGPSVSVGFKLKERPKGFLVDKSGLHRTEIFDYVVELHNLLWDILRHLSPGASGNLSDQFPINLKLEAPVDMSKNEDEKCIACELSGSDEAAYMAEGCPRCTCDESHLQDEKGV